MTDRAHVPVTTLPDDQKEHQSVDFAEVKLDAQVMVSMDTDALNDYTVDGEMQATAEQTDRYILF
jgi:hypothetical protein